MRCKRYKFDVKHGFRQSGGIRNESFEWEPDILPQFMNFILHRTCHVFVGPNFYTKHYPGGFIFRFIAAGNATYTMKDTEWELEPGDFFISIPGIPIELYNSSTESTLEWYEFQILGKRAYDTFCLTGCSVHNPVRKTENPEDILPVFQRLHEYCSRPDRKYLKSLSLLMELLDLFAPEEIPQNTGAISPEEQLVRDVKHLLNSSHFSLGKNIEELASQYFQVNRTTLFRAFRKVEGIPPKKYLLDLRLNRAKELLQTTVFSLSEIAEASGFRSSKYFINFFHKRTGFTPEEWRTMIQKS